MEQSSQFPACFHRVTIKGLCVRDGKLLMIREAASLSNNWELPGGGLDFGEDIRAGFEREIQEEMGLKLTKMSKSPIYVWTYKYEGKRDLDWFYTFVVAYRVEFEDLNITPSEECEEIRFYSKDELQDVPTFGQMAALPQIFDPADFTDDF